MKHLVIGQCQKAPNFSAFHWSPHGSLVSIGQHFVTMRIVHLPIRAETSLITEWDQSGPNHRIGPGCVIAAINGCYICHVILGDTRRLKVWDQQFKN